VWGLLLLCQRLRAVDLDLGAEEKAVCSSMQVSFLRLTAQWLLRDA
jgi:hypothetical protein